MIFMSENTILTESGIYIHEQIVAPTACWTTVTFKKSEVDRPKFDVIKLEFDRAYPYIWVKSPRPEFNIGVALTQADVENTAAYDEEGNFSHYKEGVDGVMPVYRSAFCVAVGARKSIYLIPTYLSVDEGSEKAAFVAPVYVSAQESHVCPFAMME